MLFCLQILFLQNTLFEKNLSGIPSVSNSLVPDQAQPFVWPNLSPKCLSEEDNSRQTVKGKHSLTPVESPATADLLRLTWLATHPFTHGVYSLIYDLDSCVFE